MKTNQATAAVFFTAFKALQHSEQEAFIEKVVGDARLREDLMDLALLEAARKVKGKPVSAKTYFDRRRRQGKDS
jgi:hypothetical protein